MLCQTLAEAFESSQWAGLKLSDAGGASWSMATGIWSRRKLLDSVCTSLARRAAELLVFGPELSASGAKSDLRKATETATRMVRHLGHGERIGRVDASVNSEDKLCTDVDASSASIEALLQVAHARATAMLATHRGALLLVGEAARAGFVEDRRKAFAKPCGPANRSITGVAPSCAINALFVCI